MEHIYFINLGRIRRADTGSNLHRRWFESWTPVAPLFGQWAGKSRERDRHPPTTYGRNLRVPK